MSKGSFALQSGETIVWQGKPFYRRWGLPLAILVTVVFTATYTLLSPSLVSEAQGASHVLALIFGIPVLLWLYIDAKYAGVTYYVTDRRVVRSQRLSVFRNTREIPLQSLVRIGAKRRFGRGFMVFQSQDTSTLTFGNLRENPEEVKKTTERTILAGRGNLHQE